MTNRILIVLILLGIALCINTQLEAAIKGQAPAITFSSDTWLAEDFDSHLKAKYTFLIKNSGTSTLLVHEIKGSCKCLDLKLEPSEIQPGETAGLKVIFTMHPDRKEERHYIYVKSNDPVRPTVRLNVYRLASPPQDPTVALYPERWDFGVASVGDSPEKKIKIYNVGLEDLEIKGIEPDSGCEIEFISKRDILKPGHWMHILVKAKPLESEGVKSFTVLVKSNDAINPIKRILITGYVKEKNQ